MLFGIIVLVLMAVTVWYAIRMYNSMVSKQKNYENAFAQIDTQLKRRYDLIPNLVESVKGYMAHESQVLENVIKARNQAASARISASKTPGDESAMQGLMAAEGALNGALGRLFALQEAYPDLKANTNMSALMEELVSTENKIGYARQFFNDAVTSYNTQIAQFPELWFASMFGFKAASLLEATQSEQERQAVKVSF